LSFKSPFPRLETYVLRESVLPFFLGFGLVTFLFVIDFLFDYLDLILSKGVPPLVVGELFLLALGWITALSVPCGALVAALMTFGRLAQDNEITAMRALGVNVGRILRAPLLAAVVLAGLLTLFNNYVLPETNHRFANLTLAIHRKKPAAKIQPGIFINSFDNYSFLVKHIDDKTGEMEDITIYDYSESKIPTTILAKRGHMEYIDRGTTLKLDLYDGEIHSIPGQASERKYRRGYFTRETLYLRNPGAVLRKVNRTTRGKREMSIGMMLREVKRLREQKRERLAKLEERAREAGYPSLEALEASVRPEGAHHGFWRALLPFLARNPSAAVDSSQAAKNLLDSMRLDWNKLDSTERNLSSYLVEIHKKFSIPFACVVFILVGGPLGIRTRKGGFANMAVAVAFFIVYYLFLIGGEQLADRRLFSPALAMWLPNLVFGVMGIYLAVSVTGWGPSRGMR